MISKMHTLLLLAAAILLGTAGPAAAWTYCCKNGNQKVFDCADGTTVSLLSYGLTTSDVDDACDESSAPIGPTEPLQEAYQGWELSQELNQVASDFHGIAVAYDNVTQRIAAGEKPLTGIADDVEAIVDETRGLIDAGLLAEAAEEAAAFVELTARIIRHLAHQALFDAHVGGPVEWATLEEGLGDVASGDESLLDGSIDEGLAAYRRALDFGLLFTE